MTGDFGILMQDSFPLEEPLEALLGLQVQQDIRSLFVVRCVENSPGMTVDAQSQHCPLRFGPEKQATAVVGKGETGTSRYTSPRVVHIGESVQKS